MSEKYLNKEGLIYTLQKLKPMIDSKANKDDVYTKEEYDERIRSITSEKEYTAFSDGGFPQYIKLGTIDFSNKNKFSGSFYAINTNDGGRQSIMLDFYINKIEASEALSNTSSLTYRILNFYMKNTWKAYSSIPSGNTLLITPKDKNTAVLYYKAINYLYGYFKLSTSDNDMFSYYSGEYDTDITFDKIKASDDYNQDIKYYIYNQY